VLKSGFQPCALCLAWSTIKMSELRNRAQNESYDIIGISETWANGTVNDAEMNTDG